MSRWVGVTKRNTIEKKGPQKVVTPYTLAQVSLSQSTDALYGSDAVLDVLNKLNSFANTKFKKLSCPCFVHGISTLSESGKRFNADNATLDEI